MHSGSLMLIAFLFAGTCFSHEKKVILQFGDTCTLRLNDSMQQTYHIFYNDSFFEDQENDEGVFIIKYTGKDTLIANKWTNDPFYICRSPGYAILPHSEFNITVCFEFHNRRGYFQKYVGLRFQNGINFTLILEGTVYRRESQK